MRTLIVTAAALLIAGSAFAQSSTEGQSKGRQDLRQNVPQSQGAQVPQSQSGGSKARKDQRPDVPATQGGTSTPSTTDQMDPNQNPRTIRK